MTEDAVGMPAWQLIQDSLLLWTKAFATRHLCACLGSSSSQTQQREQGPDPANTLPCQHTALPAVRSYGTQHH